MLFKRLVDCDFLPQAFIVVQKPICEPHARTHTYTPSCCHEYPQEDQMQIHPLLKIVPNKCSIASCLSDACWKLQWAAVVENYWALFSTSMSSVGTNELGAERKVLTLLVFSWHLQEGKWHPRSGFRFGTVCVHSSVPCPLIPQPTGYRLVTI